MKSRMKVLYKKLSRKRECRENQFSYSHTLLKGVNEFPLALSILFYQSAWRSGRSSPRCSTEQMWGLWCDVTIGVVKAILYFMGGNKMLPVFSMLFVRCVSNSAHRYTKFSKWLWVPWKLNRCKPYFTQGRKLISYPHFPNLLSYLTEFRYRDLHLMVLNVREFREERQRPGRTLCTDVNVIINFQYVPYDVQKSHNASVNSALNHTICPHDLQRCWHVTKYIVPN